MSAAALAHDSHFKISYGIYTVERVPHGSKRRAKWDLHSIAEDRDTAENHAKSLAAQPYFSHVEVQEFRTCSETKKRTVKMVKTYSRHPSLVTMMSAGVLAFVTASFIALMLF